MLLAYDDAQIERWDREWANYLVTEHRHQLLPYSAYPDKPALPETCTQLMDIRLGSGQLPLSLYCRGSDLLDRSVMEMGCGCGNLGKLLGRYARRYLGVDCSRLALGIARLVSPDNCVYVHVNEHEELRRSFGRMDTIVSRFFWIHQNRESAERLLPFLESFLRPGGRLYMDFFCPAPARAADGFTNTWLTFTADDPLSNEPSAMYSYTLEDVERLLAPSSLRIVGHEVHGASQRRYVIAQKQ
jgi:SAM-dependent methyltransferase